jgi:long-chain acyl-CoA synthetase
LLPAGEYIAVEKIENVLKSCPLVEQVWVYGNSFESCLVAVAVPAEKPIMAWAAGRGIRGTYQVRVSTICVYSSMRVTLRESKSHRESRFRTSVMASQRM